VFHTKVVGVNEQNILCSVQVLFFSNKLCLMKVKIKE